MNKRRQPPVVQASRCRLCRRGAALDYVLVLAATFPVILIATVYGKRIMALVWELLCVQVSWPFL